MAMQNGLQIKWCMFWPNSTNKCKVGGEIENLQITHSYFKPIIEQNFNNAMVYSLSIYWVNI